MSTRLTGLPLALLGRLLVLASILLNGCAVAETISATEQPVYATRASGDLRLWVWRPGAGGESPKPAVILFHGGGWVSGSPAQFAALSERLAASGVVVFAAEYRLTKPPDPQAAVQDARAAVRWVREHAPDFSVDPDRIAAGGGSAGGYLALGTVAFERFPAGGGAHRDRPDALILFNPMLESSVVRTWIDPGGDGGVSLAIPAALDGPLPPTLVMHGTADKVAPHDATKAFFDAQRQKGSPDIEWLSFPGRGHGFFNHGSGRNPDFARTTERVVAFLKRLGWLDQAP